MYKEHIHSLLTPFSKVIDRFAHLWNGYEVHGWENIPQDRASLLVLYHGFFPLDIWYLSAGYWLQYRRVIHGLADRWMFKVPGLAWILKSGGTVPGNRKDAIRLLNEGHTVVVSPGGVREALAPYEKHYQLIWGNRLGFAHVALEAGVDLIPVFSENVEELYRSPGSGSKPIQWLYEKTRWPIVPIVGLGVLPFPVQLTTWIGEPVRHDPKETPEQLRDRMHQALQKLIDKHQDKKRRLFNGLRAHLEKKISSLNA